MILSFFIWCSLAPPVAGREGGEERAGGHPRSLGHGTGVPGTPCFGSRKGKRGGGHPPFLSSRDFLEDTSSTLLLLRVSPQAKRAKEKNDAGGTPPRPPGKGCAPCNPA